MSETIKPSAIAQQQFLDVVSKEEALARWHKAYPPRRLGSEKVRLEDALARVLAQAVNSPIDVPPFDRALVDGFAIRSVDSTGANEAQPRYLALTRQSLACGDVPTPASMVEKGSATWIATGAMMPRGADSVVMVEHSEPDGVGVAIRQAVRPGQAMAFAGSDIARGETVLLPGTVLGSRDIGVLAACGISEIEVVRQPRIAVISTGDELVTPGEPLEAGAIYDSNSAILAAAITEIGGLPVSFGVIRDDEKALRKALADAMAGCDMLLVSGGTSKGNGDLTHRIVAGLGAPGIVVHGVALKPGKPLCLAVADGKPIALLPGFPTSAIVTFQTFVAPLIRAMAGLASARHGVVEAVTPLRIVSELGRSEFAMVTLASSPDGLKALATGKGSGAVTSFSQADGFVEIAPLVERVEAGSTLNVTMIAGAQGLPDLLIAGSQCVGLNALSLDLVSRHVRPRLLALGSQAGLAMAKRDECDVAPIHLLDAFSNSYNAPFVDSSLDLVPGWLRLQGLAFRKDDPRFAGREPEAAIRDAAHDAGCIMVNRNPGAGTRVLIDRLLEGAQPPGWSNQPRSHNAVAAAVAQGRADWGITIAPIAAVYGLGFAALAEEHYDFVIPAARRGTPAIAAFLAALRDEDVRSALVAMGFKPR